MENARKTIMRFLFPFSKVPKGCRLVIYGAGEVGYDFYRQLKTSEYAEVALWVDRQYEWFRKLNLPVESPEMIKNVEYDFIVVTAEAESVYNSIHDDLVELGVSEEKILWNDDYTIHENIVYGYEDRDIAAEMENAVLADPVMFVNEDRLDIIIRYLYALEILNGETGGKGEQLYTKFIMAGCGAKEPTENYISAYFSEYSGKRGIGVFKDSFCRLVDSMNRDGFRKDGFLPVASTGSLINGAHRVAAALACNQKVWYVQYPFNGLKYVCDRDALSKMEFNDCDIKFVFDCYEKLITTDEYGGK
nr:hypothetical protein [uncultured Butyrivibrio sp.]